MSPTLHSSSTEADGCSWSPRIFVHVDQELAGLRRAGGARRPTAPLVLDHQRAAQRAGCGRHTALDSSLGLHGAVNDWRQVEREISERWTPRSDPPARSGSSVT